MSYKNQEIMCWTLGKLADLGVEMSKAASDADYSYEYPVDIVNVEITEARCMSLLVNQWFGLIETQCALHDLASKMGGQQDLNHFFYRMHMLGHHLFELHFLDYDTENQQDAAFIELVSLFFAMSICKLYFGINELTEPMIDEIASSLHDAHIINEKVGVEKYSATEMLETCDELLIHFNKVALKKRVLN